MTDAHHAKAMGSVRIVTAIQTTKNFIAAERTTPSLVPEG